MNSRAVIGTISFLLLTILSFAQNDLRRLGSGVTNGSLVINARDSQGRPLADARVELRDMQYGQVVKSGYTNPAGILELNGLAFGSYDVSIAKGLNEVTERTDIRALGAALSVQLGDGGDPSVGGKSSVSVAQFKVPGKARKELNKAREALADRKVEEAEKHLAKALEIYPKYADALTTRAIIKMDQNQLEAAATDLVEALQYDPANPTTYFVYGANFNMQSKFDQAIESLERGVALDPTGWQGYFELGKANVGKQNYKQALKYLEKAQAAVNFEYPPIHLVKAHALLALKQYPQAMDELQVFLAKSPQDPSSEEARKTLEQVRAFVQR